VTDLVRVSFSIEKPLLDQLEKLVSQSKYENRSLKWGEKIFKVRILFPSWTLPLWHDPTLK